MKVQIFLANPFYSYFGYKLKMKYRNLANFNPFFFFLAPPPHFFWQLKKKSKINYFLNYFILFYFIF